MTIRTIFEVELKIDEDIVDKVWVLVSLQETKHRSCKLRIGLFNILTKGSTTYSLNR